MRTHCTHIARKRGIYYFRRRLPRPVGGEILLSLRTHNYREAEFLAEALARRCQTYFDEQMTDYAKITALLRAERDRLLVDCRDRIIRAPFGKPVFVGDYDGPPEGAQAAEIEQCDWFLQRFRTDLSRRDLRAPEGRIRELMEEHGIPDADFEPFGLLWFDMYIQYLSKKREWLANGPLGFEEMLSQYAAQSSTERPGDVEAPRGSPLAETGPKLSDVLPGFIELMVTTGEWTGQTRAQNAATYAMFMGHCGDRPVATYDRRDCASFFDALRGLPAMYSKKPEWRDLPLSEVVTATRDQDVDRLTMKTIKRHFSALGRLFDFLRKRGEYPHDNPAHDHDFPTGKARANDGRQMWQGEKLSRLFASPVWAGCASPGRRSIPGALVIRDEKYWLPLLGLFHGNRLEEFAQLVRHDVRCEDGIWFFDINDDGTKQIKNAQSARRVPIHPRVLDLGFLQYVSDVAPAENDPLFPDLKPGGPDRKLGYHFSKWFSRYRREIGLFEKGLDYHSFRHGVTTKLFANAVEKVVVDALTGHEGEGISEKVYLKQLPLQVLLAAIRKVEWPR